MAMEPPLYIKISDAELLARLQSALASRASATDFWRALTDYPLTLLREGNVAQAQALLIEILRKCRSLAPQDYPNIHKGSPFYWLAISAFLLHDYQTAGFFLDATISEDLQWGAEAEKAPTPAMSFAMLEGGTLNPSAQKIVQAVEAKAQVCLEFYKSLNGKPVWLPDLALPRLRMRFLRPALSKDKPSWRRLAIALITFFSEWDFRSTLFDLYPVGGAAGPFYLHLLKGCVLFESLARENPKKKPTGEGLEAILQELGAELGITGLPKRGGSFNQILYDLAQAENKIETALLITSRLRGVSGIDLQDAPPLSRGQYQRLFEMTAAACLYIIACLY